MSNWDFGWVTVHGKNHIRDNKENQDFINVFQREDCVVLVGADGAGSAAFSKDGASAAVKSIVNGLNILSNDCFIDIEANKAKLQKSITDSINEIRNDLSNPVDKKTFKSYFQIKRRYGENIGASQKKIDISQYASTLMVAICSKKQFFSAHIGDGYIFAADLDYHPETKELSAKSLEMSEPRNGEYDNQTFFFTDENWRENLRFYNISFDADDPGQQFNTVAVLTDGADSFFIGKDRKSIHLPLMESLIKIVTSQKGEKLSNLLPKIFTQKNVHAVTGDDATIGLAIRTYESNSKD